MWLWWREGRPWPVGLVGAVVLVLYGLIPTYQAAHFGRVYAAYGGTFVVLSLLWGWAADRIAPDRYDLAGAVLCLLGVAVIMYSPRPA
jgi:small multidrug resistance family-3 protein